MKLLYIPLFCVLTACGNPFIREDPSAGMKRFADWNDKYVREHNQNIDAFLSPHSGVLLEGAQETRPGVMEYSFVGKIWFTPDEKKCRFIFVVEKDTGTIIGWSYKSKPEYCYNNR